MAVFFLETSALLKRYKEETGSDLVRLLFSLQQQGDLLVASYFALIETESALTRGFKGRLFDEETFRLSIRRLTGDFRILFIQPVPLSTLRICSRLVRNHALKAADALHLATAIELTERSGARPIFASSDEELVRAATQETFQVVNPTEKEVEGNLLRQRRLWQV